MMIDANLLVPLMQYVSNEIPLHWVDLATPIGGTAAALSFKIWTWGYKQLVSIPVPGGGPKWELFAEKARELITKDKVAVVFGCWTSVSRKTVLPVFKELSVNRRLGVAVAGVV